MHEVVADKQSWELPEGHEIAPGRTVLKSLGGGNRYEVYLVWDERLDALAHPVILRGFGSWLEGPHPHVLVEHLEGPTLRRLIRRGGPFPGEQVLPLALHVASAIHYMAVEGWVH